MATTPSIGAVFGAIISGYIVDKIGRKTCILFTSPMYFTAWIALAFAPSLFVLAPARFLQGVADGFCFTVVPMYLGEIADPKIRGTLVASISITTTVGLLLINIIGSYMTIRNTALVTAVVPLLHFASFYFMPESPYYLLMKQKVDKAKISLQILSNQDDVSDELTRLDDAVKEDLRNVGTILDLFTTKSNRKALIVIAGLRAIQQFSGTTAITFYAQDVFQNSGSGISPTLGSILYFIVQLIVSCIFSVLTDKLGRKPLMIVSTVGSGITIAIAGIYSYFDNYTDFDVSSVNYIPLCAIFGYAIMFNVGMQSIPVLMLGELFPTSVKAFALCLADIVFGLTVVIVGKLFQILNDGYGMYVPFLFFAFCCFVGLLFILFVVPETKGKTLEDIQEKLRRKRKKELSGMSP